MGLGLGHDVRLAIAHVVFCCCARPDAGMSCAPHSSYGRDRDGIKMALRDAYQPNKDAYQPNAAATAQEAMSGAGHDEDRPPAPVAVGDAAGDGDADGDDAPAGVPERAAMASGTNLWARFALPLSFNLPLVYAAVGESLPLTRARKFWVTTKVGECMVRGSSISRSEGGVWRARVRDAMAGVRAQQS